MGIDLVREGFVVVMLSSRAMQCQEDECGISNILLLNGFALQGIRVYEALLLIKYLKYIDYQGGGIDSTKMGIISHSGGSSTANLVVRVTDDIKAQVTDYRHPYIDGPPAHCETVPHLSYFSDEINDRNTLSFPMLQVPYGFKDCRKVIREFFAKFLKP
jgi:hypothetical protein